MKDSTTIDAAPAANVITLHKHDPDPGCWQLADRAGEIWIDECDGGEWQAQHISDSRDSACTIEIGTRPRVERAACEWLRRQGLRRAVRR